MPSRYFAQNPLISGPLEFLAGYGQQQQQMNLLAQQQRSRQNEMLGQGLGQGVGNFAQGYAQQQQVAQQRQYEISRVAQQQQFQAQQLAQQHQHSLQLQKAYQEGYASLEQARTANDVYQADRNTYIKQWGETPEQVLQQVQAQAVPQPQESAELLAYEKPEMFGVPLPQIRPELTAQYRQADEMITQLSQARTAIAMKPGITPQEVVAADKVLIPEIQKWQKLRKRYPQPQPPTMQQIVQQAAWTDPATGVMWHDKNITPTLPSKATEEPAPTYVDPVSGETLPLPKAGVVPYKDGLIITGNVKFEQDKTKAAKEEDQWAEAEKAVIARHKGEDAYTVTTQDVLNYIAEKKTGVQKLKEQPKHDALLMRGAELIRMANEDVVIPSQVEAWFENLKATYGDDPANVPDDLKRQFEHLRRLTWDRRTIGAP